MHLLDSGPPLALLWLRLKLAVWGAKALANVAPDEVRRVLSMDARKACCACCLDWGLWFVTAMDVGTQTRSSRDAREVLALAPLMALTSMLVLMLAAMPVSEQLQSHCVLKSRALGRKARVQLAVRHNEHITWFARTLCKVEQLGLQMAGPSQRYHAPHVLTSQCRSVDNGTKIS